MGGGFLEVPLSGDARFHTHDGLWEVPHSGDARFHIQ